jgi:hypothetical protein
VNGTVMHLAKWRSQLRIVMSACCVMFLDAQNARRHSDSKALTLSLPRFASRRADWSLIFHSLPLLNAR